MSHEPLIAALPAILASPEARYRLIMALRRCGVLDLSLDVGTYMQELSRHDGNGQVLLSAGAVLLLASGAAHDPDNAMARERGATLVTAMLGEIRKARYPQADVLETLLAKGEPSERLLVMARTAGALLTKEAMQRALAAAGLGSQPSSRDSPPM